MLKRNFDGWQVQARDLIRAACTPWGIKASLVKLDNYNAIFTRDAVMSGVVGLLLKDDIIINGLKNTLVQLKKRQGKQGQIPSNFTIGSDQQEKISYGTLSPKIDSCTWYLIGVGLLIKAGRIESQEFEESTEKVVNLLDALEFNGKHLMYIPKGGNWADEYVYDGYILYDQLLRIWGLNLVAEVFDVQSWKDKSNAIKECIVSNYKNENSPHLDASFYPGGRFETFDLAAHTLAAIVMDEKELDLATFFDWIKNAFIDKKRFPPAFYPVISPGDPDWNTLAKFHLFSFKNQPHHYHNGGIWWIWLGWLSIGLSLRNEKNTLIKLSNLTLDFLNNVKEFDFEEYLSADQLIPNGTKKLCYTATGIIFLSLAVNDTDFSILKS